jgi:SOS-response transcriptional repressor LexA
MEKFKDILRARMREEGLTYEDLARRVGVTGVYVSKIVQGKVVPSDEVIEKLSGALDVDLGRLVLAAHHDKAPESVKPVFARLRRHHFSEFLGGGGLDNIAAAAIGHGRALPVVGMVRAGEFMAADDAGFPPGAADEYVYSDTKGRNLFAVRVVNDSMEPEFREGDLLIVNPNLEAQNGDFVIAKIPDENEATFKKLVRHGKILILRPLNPRYPDIVVDKPSRLAIVGKVVERKTLY